LNLVRQRVLVLEEEVEELGLARLQGT
jgi:hypothetical protein